MATVKLTADRVLAWRLRRHLLHRPTGTGVDADPDGVSVVARLCGVQAQVASAAAQAVAARQAHPAPGTVTAALADRRLLRTWAMRGTLHLLTTADAPAYLSLLAAARTWEKGAWQRTFVTVRQLDAIAEATYAALDGRILTREELAAEIVERTGDAGLADPLASGWGAVLKPLAWQGLLINGPTRTTERDGGPTRTTDPVNGPTRTVEPASGRGRAGRVTFTRPDTYLPDWSGLPDPAVAATTVVPAYLGAYGPATPETFDAWLCRGATRKATLRSWFAELVSTGELVTVAVDGEPAYARAADVDDIATAVPVDGVRLLPAFDQWILGPGTKDTMIIPAGRRSSVSLAAGWIAPTVVHQGRVVGTWTPRDGVPEVTLWPESPPVPAEQIEAEVARLQTYLGKDDDDA
ncbi:winged helix DNA-binding domain-containing protein [Micromonospora sp. CPCC 206060]|uniref:winged helix DNA-binding domain-containing protein n=1 Tax=Micromonospora sp. CPCC 206060 TaxID=3122406 RepID=UPI002FEEF4F9